MVFPVIGGDGKPTGYEIDNSLRMGPSGGDTTPHVNLRRTLGSAGTEEKFTYSCWVKISAKLEYNFWLLGGSQETSSPNQATFFRISSDGKLRLSDGSVNLNTNRLFRDPSAWYHIVLAVDSTQGTDSNRVKIYVNGVQETSFANETYPSQNLAFRVLENGVTQSIGTWLDDSGTAYACDDGYISEVYLIDGAQKAPTDFGETNDNGVWIPKDYSGTYGTHGFRFKFKQTGSSANSSGIGADTSGNDNHFSVNNSAATDVTTDTPTNNFATMNPLSLTASTFAEGNLKLTGDGGNYDNNVPTIAFDIATTNGWYMEVKLVSGATSDSVIGICKTDDANLTVNASATAGGTAADAVGYLGSGNKKINSNNSSYGDSYTNGDIIGVLVKDGTVKFSKNGTIQNSGTAAATSLTGLYYIVLAVNGSAVFEANFGNPPFAISSGNTDGKYGNFEYAPPSGYYALCTKRLAEFG